MTDIQREQVLDMVCEDYEKWQTICKDYDVNLPESEDLGYIRNYLNDNFDDVVECIDKYYMSITVVLDWRDPYGKNKKRND